MSGNHINYLQVQGLITVDQFSENKDMFLDFKIAIAKYDITPAHSRGGPSYFCRHKSNQKGFQQKGFFAARALTLQIRQNHGLQNVALLSFALASASATIAMPFPALAPTIVLPDFSRSCSADGGTQKTINIIMNLKKNAGWPDRKVGQA
jgi:hypothetical protein